MRQVRRGVSTTVAAIAAIVLLVIGLGGGYFVGSGAVAPTTVTITAPAQTVTRATTVTQTITAAAPAKEVTLTYATTQTTASFDPAVHADETTSIMVFNSYDPLLFPTLTGPPKPWLAESWTVSPDGTVYTFDLRRDVRFHDGTPLTAKDVKFSMDRVIAISRGFAWLWKGIVTRTEVVNDFRLRFVLDKPHAPFLASLVQFFVVNSALVTKNIKTPGDFGGLGDYGLGFLGRQDAGSGPYIIESFEPGAQVVFRKFKEYWGGWRPNTPDRVIFRVIGEQATEKLLIQRGEVDIVEQWLSPDSFGELKKMSGVVVKEDPSAQLFFVSMHTQKAPLDDVNVRLAISHAFDYQTAARDIFQGAVQAVGPVPILMPGHNPDAPVYKRDVAKAKEFMVKAKHKAPLKIEYVYVSVLESERKIGLLLQQNLRELGIEVEIKGETWARMVDSFRKPETSPHMAAIFNTAKIPHPDSHTFLMFHPNAWGTFMSLAWYKNDEVSKLLEQARAAPDVVQAFALYKQAQAQIVKDAPILFITNSLHRIALRDWVQGYVYSPILGYDLYWRNFQITKP